MDRIHTRGTNTLIQLNTLLGFLCHLSLCGYGLIYFLYSVFGLPNSVISTLRIGCIVFAILAVVINKRPIIKMYSFTKLYIFLITISFISSFYSVNSEAISSTTYLFNAAVIGITFSFTLTSKAVIKRFLYMMATSGAIVFLVLASKNLLYIDDRLGRTLTGGNLNMFALYIMLTLIAAIMLFCMSEKKWEKVLLLVISTLDVYMLMLSGGRKYILTPMIMCAVIMWINAKKISLQKRIIILLIAIVVIYFGWNFMMTNEVVYMSIGRRFENQEGAESRLDLILYGLEYFLRSPFYGYGENAFEVLIYPDMGVSMYSHNNYVELLVNLGLIGFLPYYFVYFGTIKKLYNKINNNKIFMVFFAFMVASLFLKTGIVAYNSASLWIEYFVISCILAEEDSLLDISENDGVT